MSKKNELTYQKAYSALEKLVVEIEQGKIPLDQLSEKVQEAKDLVDFCTNRLRAIEVESKKVSGEDWPIE